MRKDLPHLDVNMCNKWTHWDLNPGPSACGADVIPLHHVPAELRTSCAHAQCTQLARCAPTLHRPVAAARHTGHTQPHTIMITRLAALTTATHPAPLRPAIASTRGARAHAVVTCMAQCALRTRPHT